MKKKEESIGHIVWEERLITGLLLTCIRSTECLLTYRLSRGATKKTT